MSYPSQNHFDYFLKLNIVGKGCVGKTSLLERFCMDYFDEKMGLLIGVDFRIKEMEVDNKLIKCQVWDLGARSERFSRRSPTSREYLRGSKGLIILYDITFSDTFDIIKTFIKEINENGPPDVKKILVGTKCDLEDKRQVTEEQGKKLADELVINFFEVSAKTGKNVNEAFSSLVREIIKDYKEPKPTILIKEEKDKGKDHKCTK